VGLYLGAHIVRADEPTGTSPASSVLRKKGSIIIAGGGPHKGPIDDAFTLRAGKRVGIITTASGHAGTKKTKEDIPYYWMTPPEGVEVDLLHPTDPRDVDDPSFADCIDDWTAAWVPGGAQKRLEIFRNTLVLEKLRKLWERGGVIGGTSAGAAVMGDIMIRQGYPEPELCEGFGFVPNAVFDQHVDTRNRMERLLRTLRKHPTHAGVGIAEETAVLLDEDENAEVIGKGTVNFHAPNSDKPIIFYPGDIFNLRTSKVHRKQDRGAAEDVTVGVP
jgi:cyanophycinase